MKEYTTKFIRNIVLASHGSAGKTLLTEAFLHFTGATTRLGSINDGSTVSDFEEEEVRRGLSLSTAVIPVEYRNVKFNFLDTPGYTDFVGEVISAMRVADSALILVEAVSGVEVGTEVAWHYASQFNLPRFFVINKMDRDNANFQKALDSLQTLPDARPLVVQLPWGQQADFKGVIDLLSMKAYQGIGKEAVDIPAELADSAEEARMQLIEAAAEGDDELLMKYLDGETLSPEEILQGLRGVVLNGSYQPVFVAAGGAEIGIAPLLDTLTTLAPSPADMPQVVAAGAKAEENLSPDDNGPLAVYVWKTTADPFVGKVTYFRIYSGAVQSDTRLWNQNKGVEERFGTVSLLRGKEQMPVKVVHAGDIASVPKLNETATGDTLCDKGHPLTLPVPEYPNALYRVAVFPKSQSDSAKISTTLSRLCEEDMTLSWYQEPSTNQTILQGMGDQHIDVAIRKAEKKFQTALLADLPKVPYQEAITKTASAQYRHKKQTGGAGQFAEVHMRLEPNPESDYEFAWEVVGGAVSASFQPSIEKGIQSVLRSGVIAGYPVVNVKVAVYDGKEHPVDSKPVAFEVAGREAFKAAFRDGAPVLMEPIYDVHITVPEEHMGDVLGDLNSRRARVQGMNTDKGRSIVTAQVPLAEIQRYTTDLRSITGGRGVFTMEFSHYERVPAHIAQEVIDARKKEHTEE
ncbi:MAG: elongation factor G [Anaerolineales bacterium]